MSVSQLDVFFGKMFLYYAHYVTRFFIFGVLSLISSSLILDTNLLSDMSFANIFFHFVDILLVLLIVSFTVQKPFILIRSQKFVFAFVSLASGDISREKLPRPRSKRLLPAFSFKILMASCLTFRFFIHFEFIFVYGIRK